MWKGFLRLIELLWPLDYVLEIYITTDKLLGRGLIKNILVCFNLWLNGSMELTYD